ncbi:hypothetical protein N7495_000026 [Penicillium taxi]|uniref:uncharacterized protein n=1 Tax=Penicillium taxi TaxID=168475 RepID=UPI002544D909|nr:uncharacterized protein N7495_000026 [Penicillium taxi]KAJ5907344.1 hypothetical protein N7495_000026 [Penicillium taxi]
MPEGCNWEGETEGVCSGGSMTYGDGKFELVADSYIDRTGSSPCQASSVRSLCCRTDSALEKCSWSYCGNSCNSIDYTFEATSPYAGSNLEQDDYKYGSGDASFCCPSEDTYEGCAWYGCSDNCPSSKNGTSTTYTSGKNKLCCDPPSSSNSWPMDPEDLFEYPDEENVSYDYTMQKSSNDEDISDTSEDPFTLVMIDGDTSAYDESLVDQWTFLTDDQELRKRDLKFHKRNNIFKHRNDTFENVVEVFHIQCTNLFMNGSACTSIFEGSASNKIVKMPNSISTGPYARLISLIPLDTRQTNIFQRSTSDVYELTIDYDFAAAAVEQKGDCREDITDTPASRKRWFGGFDSWLKKMTTIYDETMKLYHAYAYCLAIKTEATFDIDAFINLALYNQYGYCFEGSILPTPEVISAYGYFSIEPVAEILLTIRANAIMQSSSGSVELFSLGFLGMSIKGLISIGPEMALYGQLDASLSISGELNTGVSVSFNRIEVYFPQDAAGKADSKDPADLNDNDMSLTPEVRFGISVLGGDLMSGYVTAGLNNTIRMGISAQASYSNGTTSAGGEYEVASPTDPLELVSKTYIDYSSDVNITKRSDSKSLVANTTGSACFSGLISCQMVDDSATTAGNLSCPIICEGDSCTILDDGDTSSSTRKRQLGVAQYARFPAMFYNYAWFGDALIENMDQNTNSISPWYTATGIYTNIQNYLFSHANQWNQQTMGSNFMLLTYAPDPTDTNQDYACGTKSTNTVTTKSCGEVKRSLWSVQAQSEYNKKPKGDYVSEPGYSYSISCDEFPWPLRVGKEL